MTDLSHWDFAEHFSGYDAAALILGLEPRESELDQWRVHVVTDRMELHYKKAKDRHFHEVFGDPIETLYSAEPDLSELPSVALERLRYRNDCFNEETPLADWFADNRAPKFENQEFSRKSISSWLAAIGMKSVYQFERADSDDLKSSLSDEREIDPSDLPPELDAANLAYRAIANGFGDQSATPRNRLIQFLRTNFPDFKTEQIERIATVANPDKSTGRKKIDKL
ncbi:hypothetical protein [Rhodoferax mekongensis]|uniref:Uncharacterized protein n=1 Tax=Rhodoferax mekongensis TaxID=3068341 RepID=A0ABZ0AUE9_9BURK|nr:hypothetical protein [Rhodoferax sp. TBRC 17307]WNO03175.1 hypothetical protein RAN89_09475 [Rhodoferax sp. TBRC 17307]